LERNETTAGFRFSGSEIPDTKICDALIVARAAPHGSAVNSPRRDLLFPDDCAFAIRIDAVHHSGFVADQEDSFSSAHRAQDSRVAEIRIDERQLRAIGLVLRPTGEVPAVVLCKL